MGDFMNDMINETIENAKKRNFNVILVNDGKEALEKIKEMIPSGSEVMNGSSTTLDQIGFTNYLRSGNHDWTDVHAKINNEHNKDKRADLRRHAIASEYFLASLNAISKNGELVASDASGSRIGAFPFGAGKLILVASTHKITNSLEDAIKRVREVVFPLEDERAKKAYGSGSATNKWVIMEGDYPGRTTLILIKESFGF